MDYQFKNSDDYLLFRDLFDEYMYRKGNPFFWYLENKMDFKEARASHFIGQAHFSQFLSTLSGLELTSLAKEEIEAAETIVRELNIVIIREDIATNRCSYPWDTRARVQRHQGLFPSLFHYQQECSVCLPEEYEDLVDRIMALRDSLLRFDVPELVAFLQTHYQGIDPAWAEERLTFLSHYYQAREYMAKRQATLLSYRRQQQ